MNKTSTTVTAFAAFLIVGLAVALWPTGFERPTEAAAGHNGPNAAGSPQLRPPIATRGEPWRDLLFEAGRAELSVAGPLVDLGTSDQYKYTLGGWNTGWGDPARSEAGDTLATTTSRKAKLFVTTKDVPKELVLRVRSARPRQQLSVRLDKQAVGKAKLTSSWTELRFAVPKRASRPGRHIIELVFSARGKAGSPVAEFDWVWVRTDNSTELPTISPRVQPVSLGGKVRRALVCPTPRRYSYYLHVPPKAALTFEYGAEATTTFHVAVTTTSGEQHSLFSESNNPGSWTSARVDLAPFADQAIRLDLTSEQVAKAAGWGRPAIVTEPRAAKPTRPPQRPKHVVLVVYDTTRADSFAAYQPDTRVQTPQFDALAARSTTFTRAYNNEAWTRPSTATIVTGLYPDTHRAIFARDVLSSEVELISEHLHNHGFTTAAILGNSVLAEKFGFDQGWDHYENHGRTDDSADNIFGQAISWLENNTDKQSLFLWIQSHDSHTPYEVDRKYSKLYFPEDYDGFIGESFSKDDQVAMDHGKRRTTATDVQWAKALYDGEATYQDEGFGRLLQALDKLGLSDDTMIVVTNDHGEEFDDHGGWGHGYTQREEMLRAPLLVHYPPLFPAGSAVNEVVEHVDVAPTIVDALGLPPMSHADGASMVPLVTDTPTTRPGYAIAGLRDRYRTVVVGRWKLVADSSGRWKELYDLEADPAEATNRADDAPIAARLCEIYLTEALGAPRKSVRTTGVTARRRFKSEGAKLDPATRRELEALGYLGTGAPDE